VRGLSFDKKLRFRRISVGLLVLVWRPQFSGEQGEAWNTYSLMQNFVDSFFDWGKMGLKGEFAVASFFNGSELIIFGQHVN